MTFPLALTPPGGATPHWLMGTGIRQRTIFRVKVYAFGLYVDADAARAALADFRRCHGRGARAGRALHPPPARPRLRDGAAAGHDPNRQRRRRGRRVRRSTAPANAAGRRRRRRGCAGEAARPPRHGSGTARRRDRLLVRPRRPPRHDRGRRRAAGIRVAGPSAAPCSTSTWARTRSSAVAGATSSRGSRAYCNRSTDADGVNGWSAVGAPPAPVQVQRCRNSRRSHHTAFPGRPSCHRPETCWAPSVLHTGNRPPGIADAPGSRRLPQHARHRQGAMPASALRTRFSTASAPAELDRAMSNGVSPSNSGCGRLRNASMASRSPR